MTPESGEPERHLTLAQRLAEQREQLRELRELRRREQPIAIGAGRTDFSRAQVPWGVDLAAAWSWRFLVIVAAGLVLMKGLSKVSVIALPVAIAMLISALAFPVVRKLKDVGLPQGLSALLVVLVGLGAVVLLLTFAGQQVAQGAQDLADSVVQGIGKIKNWLRDGPLHASDSQINDYLDQAQKAITERTKEGSALTQVAEVGTTVGHIFAGFFVVLFSTYFFLAEGQRIWAWCVRLAPRAAREKVDSSGRVAWVSLTQFVRATVIVALVDAVGIAIVAAILGVPFVLAIGVLVFLGAFIPMVGATVAGTVAVLVALVDQGPITALLMLGGVILGQQIEGHILQPFLMGRWVSVHPLAVIVGIGCGVLVAGIAGALLAVPLIAAGNAVVQHLAESTDVGDDPRTLLEGELARHGPADDLHPGEDDGEVGDVPPETANRPRPEPEEHE